MSACPPVVFNNITRIKFQAVRARINAQADVTNAGDQGTATGFGFEATWTYSEPEQRLTIQCTKKPFIVSESLVIAKIQALVESVG